MLTAREAVYQARKLGEFLARGGDEGRWWTSKDFSPAQRAQILTARARLLKERDRPEGLAHLARRLRGGAGPATELVYDGDCAGYRVEASDPDTGVALGRGPVADSAEEAVREALAALNPGGKV